MEVPQPQHELFCPQLQQTPSRAISVSGSCAVEEGDGQAELIAQDQALFDSSIVALAPPNGVAASLPIGTGRSQAPIQRDRDLPWSSSATPLPTTSIAGLQNIGQLLHLSSQLFPSPLPSNPTEQQLKERQQMLDRLTAIHRSAVCTPMMMARHPRSQRSPEMDLETFWSLLRLITAPDNIRPSSRAYHSVPHLPVIRVMHIYPCPADVAAHNTAQTAALVRALSSR